MEHLAKSKSGLLNVISRFPGQAVKIRRLYLHSYAFRELCDDYVLAQDTLARLEQASDGTNQVEIGDYRRLIPELEVEVADHLSGLYGKDVLET